MVPMGTFGWSRLPRTPSIIDLAEHRLDDVLAATVELPPGLVRHLAVHLVDAVASARNGPRFAVRGVGLLRMLRVAT